MNVIYLSILVLVISFSVSVSNSGEVDHTKCAKCIKNAMTMLKRRHARCDEENIADVIFQKYGIAKETVAKHLKICEEESEIARHPSRPSTFVFPSFSYTKKKGMIWNVIIKFPLEL